MKKIIKWLGGILLLIFGALLFTIFVPHYDRATKFDVVMANGQLYFVLEKEYKVKGLRVEVKPKTLSESSPKEMWRFGDYYSGTVGYTVRRRQIKYGENLEGFSFKIKPEKLQKNVEYRAIMKSSAGVFSGIWDFIIVDNNKVTMTYFDPKRPKKRTVIVEKNGQKIVVPYSVSLDKDGHKVITTEPIPEKGG